MTLDSTVHIEGTSIIDDINDSVLYEAAGDMEDWMFPRIAINWARDERGKKMDADSAIPMIRRQRFNAVGRSFLGSSLDPADRLLMVSVVLLWEGFGGGECKR